MSRTSRERFATVVRGSDVDLAEAALLCAAEANPDLDIDVTLLRLEAYTDDLRTRGFPAADHVAQAAALAGYLAGAQGFTGDHEDYHHPRNSLLDQVIDRKRGLPITLSIVYLAVARRLHVGAFGIGLPGHFVVGIGDPENPVVIDPFHDGRTASRDDLIELVTRTTGGRAEFDPTMLHPEPAPRVIRRLLDNLTRDYIERGDVGGALWTIELKQLLPHAPAEDLRVYGELLAQTGRYVAAAQVLEEFAERTHDAGAAEAAAAIAKRARSKLN